MHSAVALLSAYNVTVGLGVEEQWESRNVRLNLTWVRFSLCTRDPPVIANFVVIRLLLKQTGH